MKFSTCKYIIDINLQNVSLIFLLQAPIKKLFTTNVTKITFTSSKLPNKKSSRLVQLLKSYSVLEVVRILS